MTQLVHSGKEFRLPGADNQILAKIFSLNIYRTIYYVLSCTNLVLLIIAIDIPFWVQQHTAEGSFLHMGLWATCYHTLCSDILNATTKLKAVRGLMITALISCCLALVMAVTFVEQLVKWKLPEHLISSIANNFAGLCTLASLLVMYFDIKRHILIKEIHLYPGSAYFITMFSCSLCFILGTLRLLWDRDFIPRNTDVEHTDDDCTVSVKKVWYRDKLLVNQVTPLN